MKACPKCNVGTVTLKPVVRAKPLGTWSLAGAQLKTSAEAFMIAECSSCDLNVTGRLENATIGPDGVFTGGHFVEVRDAGQGHSKD